ncbi:MAG: PKD domain-containing protein [Flavipsychrobacter sp.]|nr:PKD domain-containing protein [Flavipsychrobacter sp.]
MSSFYRHLFAGLLLLFSASTQAQVTAGFTFTPTHGCPPLVVSFTNTSTGATSYSWNLGNSTITNQTNPQTSYLTAGTYTVTLTAYGPNNTTSTSTQTITVYPPPTVQFTGSPLSGCPGTTVQFTDQSVLNVSGPATYLWDFGNGVTSTQQNASNTFYNSGFYNISLFVVNSQGCTANLVKPAYVNIFTPPAINIGANSTIFCNAPAVVNFTNSTTGTQPITYSWNFGDGNTGTGTTPTHTYFNTGSYTVTVIATDANGCKDTAVYNNYINVLSLNADFTAPDSACVHNAVSFTNTSSAHQSRTWYFGDGGTSTQNNPTYTYSTAGTYNVMLVIVNGPCIDTAIHPLVVLPQPPSNFTISPGIACPPPSTLQFTSTAPPGSTFQWDFGGGTSTAPNPTYTYNTTGVKTITMVVTTPFGCKDTIVRTDTIYNSILTIDAQPDSGCAPLPVDFSVSHATTVPYGYAIPYPSPIVSYSWNFGDGNTGTGATPSNTYVNPGIYQVTVTVQTANGCTFTDTLEVRAGIVPEAGFTAAPIHICYNDSVHFTNTSVNATGYLWLYGDGEDEIGTIDPTHYYVLPGWFTPTLIAYNNGCPDTFVYPLQIQVDSPMADIAFSHLCNPRTLIDFDNNSLGATTFMWIYGDGTTSTVNDGTHNYPGPGIWVVQLATYNAASGCRDTDVVTLHVLDLNPNFAANDTAICPFDTVTFTPINSGGFPEEYFWYVNGTFENNTPIFTHVFEDPGYYNIMLITRDINGCFDTVSKQGYILVAKPNAAFTPNPPNGCAALTVIFTDNSTDQPGTFLTNWEWDFGNGTANVTVPTVGNVYGTGGNYSVVMIVTDNVGCKDTATGLISAYQPQVAFATANTRPCVNDSVQFTNYSVGNNLTYEWSFGDGGTSTLQNPKHAYGPGTYTVTLIATDINGCKDTFTAVNYLVVASPVASFTLDSIAVCPPLLPNIQNTSTGAFFYEWDLGNGNTSFAFNPSVTYVTSGAYTITLIATNQYGCEDTAVHVATVYGFGGAFNYTPLDGCVPHTVMFQANLSNVPSITWDFNDGTVATVSATDTISHTYTVAGYYLPKLILSDGTGCQTSNLGLDTIKVDSLIMGFYANSPCINSVADFVDTSKGLFTSTTITSWWWQFHDGTTSTNQNPSMLYGPAGTYPVTLVVTSSTGCIDTLEGDVRIRELPEITACPDTVVCVGDPATLYAEGGVSYVWTPNDGTLSCSQCDSPLATTTVPATYTVEGTDVYGCKNTDTTRISLKTKTESLVNDSAMCYGDTIQLSCTNAAVWAWSPSYGLSDTTVGHPFAWPDTTITYTVISNQGSCIPDTNYVTVTVHPLPVVNLGPDIQISGGGSAQLMATGTNIDKVAWMPYSSLSCDSCLDPIATPKLTTNYIVYAFTDFGCVDTADIRVNVVCEESQIFIPTVFTPNADGQNDVFYPRGKGVSGVKSFRIYNRWGELVFERTNFLLNDETMAWDGTFKGDIARPDVYVYMMEAICDTGEPMFIKGDVTIIR